MESSRYQVPAPVRQAFAVLPAYPGSVLFVMGLNLALARHLQPDILQLLEHRTLRIQVRDAGIAFDFIWRQGAFTAARHQGVVDLAICASLHDFFLLAMRKEDPDTLFFSRRLVLEGDTELGLLVKNTLDAIDLSSLIPQHLLPMTLVRRIRAKGMPVPDKLPWRNY